MDDLREITAMEYVVQVIMIIVCIAIVFIIMYFCCKNADTLILYSNIAFHFYRFLT